MNEALDEMGAFVAFTVGNAKDLRYFLQCSVNLYGFDVKQYEVLSYFYVCMISLTGNVFHSIFVETV